MQSGEGTASSATQGGLEGRVVAGKYELVRLLGQGGMGAVYEGRNRATLKRCAVKLLLSPELAANPNVVKRFFREAKACAVVESDHIVQIFDSGADPQTGYPYMVMELLQGEDLEAILERHGAVHPLAATKLVLQAAIGLAKAHEAGIIHRDIKPANLFLTRRDSGELNVKVLDFGIAKVKMEQFHETSHGLTRTGSLLGTPLYMSPEQAQSSPDIDARSDVWSLGVALYQLLSGQLPFAHAKSLGELMVNLITVDIPLLQDKAQWVPPELAEVVHRAMSRDVSRRFRNAGELRDALSALVPDGPRLTPEMLVPVPVELRQQVASRLELTDDGLLRATRAGLSVTRQEPPKSSFPRALLVGLLGLVVLAGVGAFAWRGGRSEQASPPTLLAAEAQPSASAAPAEVPVGNYALAVGPKGVVVTVDDEPREVLDGGVAISGAPGATRRVKLVLGDDSSEQLVAITSSGPIPSRLELEPKAKPTPPRATPGKKLTEPAKAPPAPEPTPPAKPPVKKTPAVAKDLNEFGN